MKEKKAKKKKKKKAASLPSVSTYALHLPEPGHAHVSNFLSPASRYDKSIHVMSREEEEEKGGARGVLVIRVLTNCIPSLASPVLDPLNHDTVS